MVSGHGKLRPYLHRLGQTDNPMLPRKEEEEEEEKQQQQQKITDHLAFCHASFFNLSASEFGI
jgi:hypothetical protein